MNPQTRKPKTGSRKPLDDDEAVEILEQIARSGPTTAKINALRLLRQLRAEREPQAEGPADPFEDLDELEPRRRGRGGTSTEKASEKS